MPVRALLDVFLQSKTEDLCHTALTQLHSVIVSDNGFHSIHCFYFANGCPGNLEILQQQLGGQKLILNTLFDRVISLKAPIVVRSFKVIFSFLKPFRFQEDVLQVLEFIVFSVNTVPHAELAHLSGLVASAPPMSTRLIFHTLVKFVNFDAKFAGEHIYALFSPSH